MLFTPNLLLLLASVGVGAASTMGCLLLMRIMTAPRSTPGSRYDEQRIEQQREQSGTFRKFEPLVIELARFFPAYEDEHEAGLAHSLSTSRTLQCWTTAEFRATKLVEGLLSGLILFTFFAIVGFLTLAIVLGVLVGCLYPRLASKSVVQEQARRLKILRLRLPMVVDQLALMIEAGGNFEESLRTIVDEDAMHPLNQELSTVLHEIDAGRTRREALTDFKERLPDVDVSELVFAITKGEELGTPLSLILSEQAEQMRLKRSQWGEKAAAEAEVQIVFPGMLVMIACLIVIIAPILLPAAFNVFSQ